ncbi:DNA-binding protein [Actinoplanes sp. LDG1-06]|uniref:DNA-binding protein n=2 Tax=Paractinoplanes ovalisporus TaxID=2810368 RepID=A0ABS2AXK0_9ACTN|nr:DNA-binding protein [Actinoplanes ovalisporus]
MLQHMSDLFARPDPAAQRALRTYQSLTYLVDRHANSPARRSRQAHPVMPTPHEVVRLVTGIANGSIIPEPDEQDLDHDDVVAALTLLPSVRADLDSTELALLKIARSRGMTWQDIAFGLGLNTPQAAKQRYERLETRSEDTGRTDK